MIINRIRAQNVLKYAEMSIDLADHGLIAISGRNESGKSSIGETVCFALFGRTFSIAPEEIHKVVRWGENHCAVTLEFSVEDRHYVLSRFLDRDGNHSAKLVMANDPETPIARGVQGVADALFGIMGFEYEEFVESFYLAQREITTPHPHSQAIKIMAGVAPFEEVVRSLNNEIAERQELLGEIKAEWDAVHRDVTMLGINEGRMAKLRHARFKSGEQLEQANTLIDETNAGLDTCATNTGLIQRAEGAKSRAGFLRFIVLLLALAAAGVWFLLTYAPDHSQAGLARDLLAQYVPQWDEARVAWIAYLALGLGVLFLLLWARVARLKRRIAMLREQCAQLGVVLGRAREIDIEDVVEGGGSEGVSVQADELDEVGPEEVAHATPERPTYNEYEALRRMLDQGDASVRMAREYGERELAWLAHAAGRFAAQTADLDDQIEDEQTRVQEARNLSQVLDGLNEKRAEIEQRIADRRRGLELLEGAIAHLSNNFNRDVKDLVGRMLPLFTDGRYEHLQIDDGLRVRIFSSEKRDFMELDEVSSGTQRQVMLALRLALSKKLLSRTVKGKQFAFLDEPFAFFDQERTRKALHALAELGDDISQVWIVSQDFPENCEVAFDTKIYCDRNSDTLRIST